MSLLYKVFIFSILFLSLAINDTHSQMKELKLPKPILKEGKSLRQDIQERQSDRSFNDKKALDLDQLSSILWATYGKKVIKTDATTRATYTIPSAGGIYALEIFVLIGKDAIKNIEEGLYYYKKEEHTLSKVLDGDKREDLARACLNQAFIKDAPISIVIAARFDFMAQRYGERAERYVVLEAGHAAQNLYLMCSDLGLATVEIGAFIDEEVTKILDAEYSALLVMPIGYKK